MSSACGTAYCATSHGGEDGESEDTGDELDREVMENAESLNTSGCSCTHGGTYWCYRAIENTFTLIQERCYIPVLVY